MSEHDTSYTLGSLVDDTIAREERERFRNAELTDGERAEYLGHLAACAGMHNSLTAGRSTIYDKTGPSPQDGSGGGGNWKRVRTWNFAVPTARHGDLVVEAHRIDNADNQAPDYVPYGSWPSSTYSLKVRQPQPGGGARQIAQEGIFYSGVDKGDNATHKSLESLRRARDLYSLVCAAAGVEVNIPEPPQPLTSYYGPYNGLSWPPEQ